ncbi:hypothetical protein [Actinomadura rugatobispora]|uniref:Nuclear transport factor 2 family protein n=1 Tax=Actinomadura rugatobispora TaxID=1994 RepID=A0ABW1A4M6_9ACTN
MRARLVRSSPHRRPRLRTTATLALLAAASLSACGDEPSSGTFKPNGSLASGTPPTPPTAARPPSTIPTPQLDQTVLTRYREYQRVFKRVYEINDPAELGAVAMDPLLTQVTKDVERTRAKGEIWRFTNVSNAKVYARAKDGMTVYVVDCLRTLAGYRFSAKTGKRIGGGPGGAYLHRSAVRYDGATWKVSETIRDDKC